MLGKLEEILRLNPNTPLSLLQGASACFVHCMALEILGFHAMNWELGMHRFCFMICNKGIRHQE